MQKAEAPSRPGAPDYAGKTVDLELTGHALTLEQPEADQSGAEKRHGDWLRNGREVRRESPTSTRLPARRWE